MQSYCAAGVLPLAMHDQQIWVLLGSEPQKNGQVGLRWLGFGGKRESQDDGALGTALREFTEETGGVFSNLDLMPSPWFFDFQAKYALYLGWLTYTDQLPSFSDSDAERDPTLNKRELRWFPLEDLLQGDCFEISAAFPMKPWFHKFIQRERYAIRKAAHDSCKQR